MKLQWSPHRRNNSRLFVCCGRCLILVVAIVIFVVLFGSTNTFFYHDVLHADIACFPPSQLRKDVAYVIHSFADIANATNLTYWLIHGSLLGSVRYKGMLPWDYDGDIGYSYWEQNKLLREIPSKLAKYNIVFRNKTGKPYFEMQYGNAYVDLIPYAEYDTVKHIHQNHFSYYKKNTIVRVYEPTDNYYKVFGCRNADYEWIFPLKKCTFSDKQVSCPNQPERVLSEFYCWTFGIGLSFSYKLDCYKPNNWLQIWTKSGRAVQ